VTAAIIPVAEQIVVVTGLQTPYATGVIRLVKTAVLLTPNLVKADLTAVECDYSGYAAKTLTAVDLPYPDPAGGVSFAVPTQQFQVTVATPQVPNDVYGGWIEDADGNLLIAWMFTTPIQMAFPPQAIPLTLILTFFGQTLLTAVVGGVPN
jgi:hypothetical protein